MFFLVFFILFSRTVFMKYKMRYSSSMMAIERKPHMQRVLFVCHVNICRSTMAESVFAELVRRAGREGEFVIDSAATSTEEMSRAFFT